MLNPLDVIENERETVRVFVVDLDAPLAMTWANVHRNIEAAVGAELDPRHVETFPSKDLDEFGLAQFLIDGYGIAETDIAPDRHSLDGAKPHIVLLRARAFRGAKLTLTPKPPLEHLGTFGQAKADLSAPTTPIAAEATPPKPAPNVTPTQPAKGSLLPILIFLGLAALLFAVLIVPKL